MSNVKFSIQNNSNKSFHKSLSKVRGQPNKRMLPDWFFAALQTSRKCGRYAVSLQPPTKDQSNDKNA